VLLGRAQCLVCGSQNWIVKQDMFDRWLWPVGNRGIHTNDLSGYCTPPKEIISMFD
jgi:hypothetical protein